MYGVDTQARQALLHALLCAPQRRSGDVYRGIAHVALGFAHAAEDDLCLIAAARAQIDHTASVRADQSTDRRGMRLQDLALRARKVVFGQTRDLIEQVAALI